MRTWNLRGLQQYAKERQPRQHGITKKRRREQCGDPRCDCMLVPEESAVIGRCCQCGEDVRQVLLICKQCAALPTPSGTPPASTPEERDRHA